MTRSVVTRLPLVRVSRILNSIFSLSLRMPWPIIVRPMPVVWMSGILHPILCLSFSLRVSWPVIIRSMPVMRVSWVFNSILRFALGMAWTVVVGAMAVVGVSRIFYPVLREGFTGYEVIVGNLELLC
jgi:hypothetical protein